MSTGSKKQKVTQETKLDPSTQALNEMHLELQREMGPLRKQVLESLENPSFEGPEGLMLPSASIAKAFEHLFGLSKVDMRGMENESSRLFNEIALPGIINKMTAGGFGRSGALGEVAGKVGADMTMGLMDRKMGMEREGQANIINALMSLENAKLSPILGMLGSAIPFTSAPTVTGTTKQSGSSFDFTSLIPMAGAAIGTFFGGGAGGMAGGQAGGAIQGAVGGGGGGWSQPNRFSIMG